MWNRRPDSWHEHVVASSSFERFRHRIIEAAEFASTDRVVDLGAGTGYVTLEVAPLVQEICAVDLSEAMLESLDKQAVANGNDNVSVRVADLATVDFDEKFDVVMSTYALHHLRDEDKAELIRRAYRWMGPGGRMVIVDMMFGRGKTAGDRTIIRKKVQALARKGPGGWWRIVKNFARFGLRRGTELPVAPEFWVSALTRAGFSDVTYESLYAEAGMVTGVRA
ncbi:MAG: Methyltransferase type 11 [Acidimicrobiales bacterium]|nr:Methyltransferase type 11 [Acidimicrobiales bacterium]